MRKALYILGDLAEEDIVFFSRAGAVVELNAGEVLVRAGSKVEALYFVTRGEMEVRSRSTAVARLGVGDVVGEMSLIEKQPPATDVVALEPCRLLAIPGSVLEAEIKANPAFAGRFYKALATFLSDRLRSMTATVSGAHGDGELDERLLDMVHVAGDRMVRLIAMMDAGAGSVR